MGEQITPLPEDWVGASTEEMKARRAHAQHAAEQASEAAEESRRQAAAYVKAAQDLEAQAFKAEATAKQREAEGAAEGAAEFHALAADLREQAQRNYRIYDQKGRIAMEREREAFQQNTLATRLSDQIRLRARGPHHSTE